MRLNKLFFFVFLLSLPLALATTITANDVAFGTPVSIAGTCAEANVWVSIEYGFGSPIKTISVDQVTANNNQQYSTTFMPPQEGTYTVYAACQDEAVTSTTFCVGSAAECGKTPPSEDVPTGGGGSGCKPKWNCEVWSYCNASLQQTRTCFDQKKCRPKKVEVQSCAKCQESWICSLWAACQNGVQQRTCIDEHYCITTFQKPLLEKNCQQLSVSGPQPAQISNDIPPPTTPQIQQPISGVSFWEEYMWYLIGIPLAIIVLVILILVIIHFIRPEKKAYNFNELKAWVKAEKKMGTSERDIRTILEQNTGWTKEEVDQAFHQLNTPRR
jgi:hypothetical protein